MSKNRYDVIVVGGGGSGLMAALTASRFGRSVLLLEKCKELGGTTRLSVGTICVTSTPHQRAIGIADTPNEHFEDMAKFPGFLPNRDNPILRRLLVEEAPETFQLLQDIGVVFADPIPEPPHRVPRVHAIVPHSKGYIDRLAAACRRRHVEVVCSAPVTRLLSEGERVIGVEYSHASGRRETADAACVILASGDFSSADRDYKARFMTGPILELSGINPHSTGDGQRLGESVGGEIVNGDLAWGPEIRFLAPPKPPFLSRLPSFPWLARLIAGVMPVLPAVLMRPFLMGFVTTYLAPSQSLFSHGAILVNKSGQRFCDELERPQDHIGDQPDHLAYVLFDWNVAGKLSGWPNYISTAPGVGYATLSDYEKCRKDIFFKADSLNGLAKRLGVDAASFSSSISAYNSSLQNAKDSLRAPIAKPPFYALGPAKSWIVFSEGGLRVDERLQVLRRDGSPIAGLFAAGSVGQGGVLLEGHGHHLAWAFTSGRLAGRNAALPLGIASARGR